LQNKFKGRQDKLVAAQKSLQDEMDKYKKEEPTLSKDQQDKTSAKIADEQKTLSKDASDFQQDLSKEQNKMMKNVLTQLNDIISSLAKKNNYSLVLDAQAVIYVGTGSTDITKQVSKEFDSQ
jgi:outer membrane protein